MRFAELLEDLQRQRCFALVDPRHGESDVDEHPSADAMFHRVRFIDDAGDVDLAFHAGNIDGRKLTIDIVDADDPAGNSETHQCCPRS
nr:hypothetical protein [Steroidobacter gossypii]